MKMATAAMSGNFSPVIENLAHPISKLALWLNEQRKLKEDGGRLESMDELLFLSVSPMIDGTMTVNLLIAKKTNHGHLIKEVVQLGPLSDLINNLKPAADDTES